MTKPKGMKRTVRAWIPITKNESDKWCAVSILSSLQIYTCETKEKAMEAPFAYQDVVPCKITFRTPKRGKRNVR